MTDPTAVMGRRILAYLIDTVLAIAITVVAFLAIAEQADGLPANFCDIVNDAETGLVLCFQVDDSVYFAEGGDAGLVILVGLGTQLVNLIVVQGLTGATIGKAMTGVRTIRADGTKPGIGRALVRWLMFVADGFPYIFPLVGLITGLTTERHRRVGDIVANTLVVDKAYAGSGATAAGGLRHRPPDPPWPSQPGASAAPPPPPPPTSAPGGNQWEPPPGR